MTPESPTPETRDDQTREDTGDRRDETGWCVWVRGEGGGSSDISEWKLTGAADCLSEGRVVVEG